MPGGSVAQTVKRKRAISAALKEQSVYRRCVMPYTHAVTLINQAENYNNLDSFLAYCDKIDESDLVNA